QRRRHLAQLDRQTVTGSSLVCHFYRNLPAHRIVVRYLNGDLLRADDADVARLAIDPHADSVERCGRLRAIEVTCFPGPRRPGQICAKDLYPRARRES